MHANCYAKLFNIISSKSKTDDRFSAPLVQTAVFSCWFYSLTFFNYVSRYDRDSYVQIVWENIQPGKEHNFNKFSETEVNSLTNEFKSNLPIEVYLQNKE